MENQTDGLDNQQIQLPPPRRMKRAERLEARNSTLLNIIRLALEQLGADEHDAAFQTLNNAARLDLSGALRAADPDAARRTQAIMLHRIEGDGARVVITRENAEQDLWYAADCVLSGWALALSPLKQDTYDKIDYYVVFGDGEIWQDCIDLYHISSPKFETLTENIIPLIESYPILQEHEVGTQVINGVAVWCVEQGGHVSYYTATEMVIAWWYRSASGAWHYRAMSDISEFAKPFIGVLPKDILTQLRNVHTEFATLPASRFYLRNEAA